MSTCFGSVLFAYGYQTARQPKALHNEIQADRGDKNTHCTLKREKIAVSENKAVLFILGMAPHA